MILKFENWKIVFIVFNNNLQILGHKYKNSVNKIFLQKIKLYTESILIYKIFKF